jgi:hypothetical protein
MGDKDQTQPAKHKTPFSVRFAIFMLMVTATLFLPTTILFSVCLIPTLVAAIIDNQRPKTAWLTVGAMNLAGTIPAWFTLWDMGHTIPSALQLITQPVTIMVAFGGAAAGWFVYHLVTPAVAGIILKKNEYRLREIEKRQKELIRKWGEGVVPK